MGYREAASVARGHDERHDRRGKRLGAVRAADRAGSAGFCRLVRFAVEQRELHRRLFAFRSLLGAVRLRGFGEEEEVLIGLDRVERSQLVRVRGQVALYLRSDAGDFVAVDRYETAAHPRLLPRVSARIQCSGSHDDAGLPCGVLRVTAAFRLGCAATFRIGCSAGEPPPRRRRRGPPFKRSRTKGLTIPLRGIYSRLDTLMGYRRKESS